MASQPQGITWEELAGRSMHLEWPNIAGLPRANVLIVELSASAREGIGMRRREFITLLGGAAVGVADRCACAAGRADAAHRRAGGPRRRRSGYAGAPRGVPAGARTARMGGGPQRPHRLSLCAQRGSSSAAGQRTGRPATRRDPRTITANRRRVATRDSHDPDRVRRGLRSDRRWLRRQSSAARRKSHGPAAFRGQHHRQVAGDA